MSILFVYIEINSYLCSVKFRFNLIYLFMKNFGAEFNGKYLVVFNGNQVKCSFTFERNAVRAAIRYSVVKSRYIEVWYQSLDGTCELLEYWN